MGETHWANASDPRIPVALEPAVVGLAKLNDFAPRSFHHSSGLAKPDSNTGKWRAVNPEFSFPDNGPEYYIVARYDFAVIYNLSPLWNAGINDKGQVIALVEQSDINLGDVNTFCSAFGLPAYGSNGNTGAIQVLQDEAALDAEWAGAVARMQLLTSCLHRASPTPLGTSWTTTSLLS
jgi:hypothetical protein